MQGKRQRMSSESYAMNGGDGPNSYAQNCVYQRGIMEAAKLIIKEEIAMKLDIQELSLAALEPVRIADFGCSSGPNAILAIESIVEAFELKFQSHGLRSPEFQVFFNDQVSNDFNSLFALLPDPVGRKYYAAAVPGCFHGRLFPTASLHFVYSSCALNWLSKGPTGVTDEAAHGWNQGRIHYLGAPKEVFDAYSDQFAMDVNSFLQARVKEIAPGGLMALNIPAVQDDITHPEIAVISELELLGSCLMDLAKKGIVSEAKIDTLNVPYYLTSPKELRPIIEENGCFSIERMETLNHPELHIALPGLQQRTLLMRAAFEAIIAKHFGIEIMDQLFEIYSTKLSKSSLFLNPNYEKIITLFVLLKSNVNQ